MRSGYRPAPPTVGVAVTAPRIVRTDCVATLPAGVSPLIVPLEILSFALTMRLPCAGTETGDGLTVTNAESAARLYVIADALVFHRVIGSVSLTDPSAGSYP